MVAVQLPSTFLVHKCNAHCCRDHVRDLPAVEIELLRFFLGPLDQVSKVLHEHLFVELLEERCENLDLLVMAEFIVFNGDFLACQSMFEDLACVSSGKARLTNATLHSNVERPHAVCRQNENPIVILEDTKKHYSS